MRLVIFLLFLCFQVNAQMIVNSYAVQTASSCGAGFFPDNAATPFSTGCEVNGIAGFSAEAPANWTITSDSDSDNGLYAVKMELIQNLSGNSHVELTLTGLTVSTSYEVRIRAKKSGTVNMRMRLEDGWASLGTTGFFGNTYEDRFLIREATSSTAVIDFLSTSTGDIGEFMLIDNIQITAQYMWWILLLLPALSFGQITSNGSGHYLGENPSGVALGSSVVTTTRVEAPPVSGAFNITLTEKKSFPTAVGPGRFAASDVDNTWTVRYIESKSGSGGTPGSFDNETGAMTDKTILLFAVGGHFDNSGLSSEFGHSNIIVAGQTANDIGGVHMMADDFTNTDRRIYWEDFTDLQIRYVDVRGGWWRCQSGSCSGGNRDAAWVTTNCYNAIFDHISSGWSSYSWLFSKIPDNDYINNNGGLFTIQHSFFFENGRNHNLAHVTGIQMDYVRANFPDTNAAQEGAWASWEDQLMYRNLYVGVGYRYPNTSGNPGTGVNVDAINNWAYGPTARLSRHTNGIMSINHQYNVFELGAYAESTWLAKDTSNELNQFDDSSFYNLGHSGAAGTPISPVLHLDGQGNWFINTDGTEYTGFTNYADTWEDFQTNEKITGGRLSYSETYTPSYAVPIETNRTTLKTLLQENTGANIRFLGDTPSRDDDTENNTYLDWFENSAGPTTISSSNGDGGVGDFNRMDAIPTDWEAGAGSRNLATYDSDLDGMPDAWETLHGVTDPWAVTTSWTFTYGTSTVNVTNNAGYVNLQMYLFDAAKDFHPWYINNGYYP